MRSASPFVKKRQFEGEGEFVPQAGKMRADGERNRERLVATAKMAFAEFGADVSLNEIAQRAGLGIGTLYRHFPSREALVEEVYRREVDHLVSSADELATRHSPYDALQQWLKLAVSYIATKKIIASAIVSSEVYGSAGARITNALFQLVESARKHGDVRVDVQKEDVLRALVGFTYGIGDPNWQASALRLIDALMIGIRPQN